MRNNYIISILIVILFLAISACSIKWSEAVRYGRVSHQEIKETVEIEIHNKLIFVPISIRGKKYRFLFDTGAPFSISNELQKDNNYKILSKGNIVDSDHNRKKVNWAQVDSISVGNVLFINQTAFVGDFKANPILRCLEIDGIIGSNLIRHSNWTIDQELKTLSLFASVEKKAMEKCIAVPFKTDFQYNIFIDVNIGQAKVKNILVDYGSNGSMALSNEIFTTLKDRNIIRAPLLEKGSKQSGIIGNPIALNREITYSDSVKINNQKLNNVLIQTGKTVSIGNDLLSRFQVTIDWDHKHLFLTKLPKVIDRAGLAGFRLGYSMEKGVYIQSVIENSNAYKSGIRPNMSVVKIDDLDFERGNDFCDLVSYKLRNEIFLQLINSTGQKLDYHFEKTFY